MRDAAARLGPVADDVVLDAEGTIATDRMDGAYFAVLEELVQACLDHDVQGPPNPRTRPR